MNSNADFDSLFDGWLDWVKIDLEHNVRHWYLPRDPKPFQSNPRFIRAIASTGIVIHEVSKSPSRNKDYPPKPIEEFRQDFRKMFFLPNVETNKNNKELGIISWNEFKRAMFLELKRFESGDRTVHPLDTRIAEHFGITSQLIPLGKFEGSDDTKNPIIQTFRQATVESSETGIGLSAPDQQALSEPTLNRVELNKEPIHYDLANLRKELERTRVDDFGDIERLEEKYRDADLKGKETVSFRIERGAISEKFKGLAGFKCMVCEVMGLDPYSFKKKNSDNFFVETHHVVPVHRMERGTLGAANLMTVCPNHHRQIHYGITELVEITDDYFLYRFEGNAVKIPKIKIK